ncbi:hypothetical protein TWF481_002598 [Arthrobotrys musiformis]|uniref:Uncharacterized protein n=1 Tax=Arthrobotrys musiformis TaxID=47236 RepID=A0AAV9VQT2_9PEZI
MAFFINSPSSSTGISPEDPFANLAQLPSPSPSDDELPKEPFGDPHFAEHLHMICLKKEENLKQIPRREIRSTKHLKQQKTRAQEQEHTISRGCDHNQEYEMDLDLLSEFNSTLQCKITVSTNNPRNDPKLRQLNQAVKLWMTWLRNNIEKSTSDTLTLTTTPITIPYKTQEIVGLRLGPRGLLHCEIRLHPGPIVVEYAHLDNYGRMLVKDLFKQNTPSTRRTRNKEA